MQVLFYLDGLLNTHILVFAKAWTGQDDIMYSVTHAFEDGAPYEHAPWCIYC